MAEESNKKETQVKVLMVSSSPHLGEPTTSRRVMYGVAMGMLLPLASSLYLFRLSAAAVLVSCLAGAVITEWAFNAVRKRPQTVADGSVIVTALILGLSLPPTIRWWAAVIGSVAAVAIGKMVFGGLGSNIFNPAMVGRAFLMACFGTMMTTWVAPKTLAVTQATPLQMTKQVIKDAGNAEKPDAHKVTVEEVNGQWKAMFLGSVSGSLGETSALFWLVGGVFLLVRRTITVHIPIAVVGSAAIISLIAWWVNPDVYANPVVQLSGGGLMMCAFFIATDPVGCPLSKLGRVIFGLGVGSLIMLIRLKGGYPEGVMYAVLLMNSVTPLLDRWTRPRPLGGHVSVG